MNYMPGDKQLFWILLGYAKCSLAFYKKFTFSYPAGWKSGIRHGKFLCVAE